MLKKILLIAALFLGFSSSVFASSWNLPGVTIISRAQRGANESLRYSDKPKSERDALRQQERDNEGTAGNQTESQGKIATDFLLATTPDEQIVNDYLESSNGYYLKRPESFHTYKSKILIHHTADDYSAYLTWGTWAMIQQLQDIYKYHAITRWRGDIWYNFIIDPLGNVYEWRAWWPWIVWAHVAWNNTPSVGIALMGNFNVQVPTDAALKSLVNLVTALARKYHINPKATTTYFKKSDLPPYLKTYTNYTIAGHLDAGITSCPGANLYPLFPEIRDQVEKNLLQYTLARAPKVILKKPHEERGSVVPWRFYSEKDSDIFLLPIRWEGVSSCTSADTSISINSCSSKNKQVQISLTKKWPWGLKTISALTPLGTKVFSFNLIWKEDLATLAQALKQDYASRKWISSSSQNINKITSKITLSDVETLISSPLNILLYELSMSYSRYEISCDGGCTILADDTYYTGNFPLVETNGNFVYLSLPNFENPLWVSHLEISSANDGLVYINNYPRRSYWGTPRNIFRGALVWEQQSIKALALGTFVDQAVVINKTSFANYMKGIAETSDTDNVQKQTLILLLAKTYTLFYAGGQNVHPSIPADADYQAIDNPDMFQKYVWAWWEKTSSMSSWLLAKIQNMLIMYQDYVPILPYFSCSAGFTRSAKEKWGRNDTPYLQSQLDFAPCFDFNGHGVGLSGKWAQYLAGKWWTLEQILQYYYPGVELINY